MSRLGYYTGQLRKARELAISELGAEKAATMGDYDICDWIDDNYAIFWGDYNDDGDHKHDEEVIALIPSEVFESIRESIVWLQR